MRGHFSLRTRLTLVVLIPLLIVIFIVSAWALVDARQRAADRFDRSLLVTALGISRDTAFTGGDALRQDTRDLLRDTSGGPVFYHVYAPDGVFVTGYATPPRLAESDDTAGAYAFYDASYHRRPVRAVRFTDQMTVDGLSGPFTFTVWQDVSVRQGFVDSLTRRTTSVLVTLWIAAALIVWFGIRFGLAPLVSLEDAIARRSVEDLSPIQRRIPREVTGIVGRLNALLAELAGALKAREEMVSNAAHQLRNPIGAMVALSEAVADAKTLADTKERSADLLSAARHASRLTQDLLALERAQSVRSAEPYEALPVHSVLEVLREPLAQIAADRGVVFDMVLPETPCNVRIDSTLLQEALVNLVSNAACHGGPGLTLIALDCARDGANLHIRVRDDGKGVAPDDYAAALERFNQITPSDGSGLGLPIARVVAEGAGGTLTLSDAAPGLCVTLTLPLADARATARSEQADRQLPRPIQLGLQPSE
ncbi:MAG: sensor histidine kinase [Pseudomonadota bacterium]